MRCQYCGSEQGTRRVSSQYHHVVVCSGQECYDKYLREYNLSNNLLEIVHSPSLPHARNERSLAQILMNWGLQSVRPVNTDHIFDDESSYSDSDMSEFDNSRHDDDLLNPLRFEVEEEIENAEEALELLRNELPRFQDLNKAHALSSFLRTIDKDIRELWLEIEPPCGNLRSVIRKVASLKQHFDEIEPIIRDVDISHGN
jgi:hypothetical protein